MTFEEFAAAVEKLAGGRYSCAEVARFGHDDHPKLEYAASVQTDMLHTHTSHSAEDVLEQIASDVADACPPTLRTGECPTCDGDEYLQPCEDCDSRCADTRQPDRRGEDGDDSCPRIVSGQTDRT